LRPAPALTTLTVNFRYLECTGVEGNVKQIFMRRGCVGVLGRLNLIFLDNHWLDRGSLGLDFRDWFNLNFRGY